MSAEEPRTCERCSAPAEWTIHDPDGDWVACEVHGMAELLMAAPEVRAEAVAQ